jgi:hypothetical protein
LDKTALGQYGIGDFSGGVMVRVFFLVPQPFDFISTAPLARLVGGNCQPGAGAIHIRVSV